MGKVPRISALLFVDPAQDFAYRSDHDIVAEHGALWLMGGVHDGPTGLLASHSLATGFFHVWYGHEVQEATDAEG
jgi:hypothetical protein